MIILTVYFLSLLSCSLTRDLTFFSPTTSYDLPGSYNYTIEELASGTKITLHKGWVTSDVYTVLGPTTYYTTLMSYSGFTSTGPVQRHEELCPAVGDQITATKFLIGNGNCFYSDMSSVYSDPKPGIASSPEITTTITAGSTLKWVFTPTLMNSKNCLAPSLTLMPNTVIPTSYEDHCEDYWLGYDTFSSYAASFELFGKGSSAVWCVQTQAQYDAGITCGQPKVLVAEEESVNKLALGLGIGIPVGLIVLTAAMIFIVKKTRQSKRLAQAAKLETPTVPSNPENLEKPVEINA